MITSRLIVLQGEPLAEEIHLSQGSFRIGRARGCYIKPMCAYTSRQHCVVNVTDELVAVKDLDSRNGTFVNGQRIEASVRLQTGDVLQTGLIRFRVMIEECAAIEAERVDPALPATVERRAASQVQSPTDPVLPAPTAGPELLTVEQLRRDSLGDSYIVRWLQGKAPGDPAGADGQGSTLNAPAPQDEIGCTESDEDQNRASRNGVETGVRRRTTKQVIEKTQEDTSRAAAEILNRIGEVSEMVPELTP